MVSMDMASAGDPYEISTAMDRVNFDVVHRFLTTSYWSEGIPRATVERAIAHSICASAHYGAEQVGFARVVSDRAVFAYVADVFVLPEHRQRGLARRMMQALQAHPDLQGLRRWSLVTRDAHAVYRGCGFTSLAHPERHMEIHNPAIYTANRSC